MVYHIRGWPRWRDRFPQYGIKVSYWGSGTLKIVIPVENHPHPNVWLLSTSTFYFYFYFLFRFSGAAGSDALQCLMHLTAFRFSSPSPEARPRTRLPTPNAARRRVPPRPHRHHWRPSHSCTPPAASDGHSGYHRLLWICGSAVHWAAASACCTDGIRTGPLSGLCTQ